VNSIPKHLVDVRLRARSLDLNNVLVFCLSCMERQKFAYDRAVTVVSSEDSALAREFLDRMWASQSPSSPLPLIEPKFDAEMAAANFAYATYTLVDLDLENSIKCCAEIAEFGLNLVDSLAYSLAKIPVTSANDELLFQGEIIQTEINRQRDNLLVLERTPNHQNRAELKLSAMKDITLGYWYSL
jgi:hypothetical protein